MKEAKHEATTYTGRERVGELLEPPASTGNPLLVEQLFGLFKDYLANHLDSQGNKLESKQKIDKETVEIKYKGNQKEFKVNVELDYILDQILIANEKVSNTPSIRASD